jgi:hypothetical protein
LYDDINYGYLRLDVSDKAWKKFGKEINDSGKCSSLSIAVIEITFLSMPMLINIVYFSHN